MGLDQFGHWLSGAANDVGTAIGGLPGDLHDLSQSLSAQNTFQASPAQLQQTNYANAISGAQAQQAGLQGQQSALGNTLLAQSQGQGPNPAQLQYQQNTQAAAQQAAGMVASQKGLNPALAARMGAEQLAGAQQGAAAGQATLQAQQQLGAQQQLAGLYGQQANQTQAGYATAIGGQGQQNTAAIQNQMGANTLNADVAKQNTEATNKMEGGILSGVGSLIQTAVGGGPGGGGGGGGGGGAPVSIATGGYVPGYAKAAGDSSRNDTVPAMLSPGEVVLPRSVGDDPEKAKAFVAALKEDYGTGKKKAKSGPGDIAGELTALKARIAQLERRAA